MKSLKLKSFNKKSFKIAFLLGALAVVIVASFQNCSEARLEAIPLADRIWKVTGQGEFCMADSYSDYTLDSYLLTNLNVVNVRDTLEADSDADGLSDRQENEILTDPYNRRSITDKILDGLCIENSTKAKCEEIIPQCDKKSNGFGLSDCDINTLDLLKQGQQPTYGLDTDNDGIPDFIEIIRKILPALKESDNDNDRILTFQEIADGTNPVYADTHFPHNLKVISNFEKQMNSAACPNAESWKFKLVQMPILKTRYYTGENLPLMSFANDNIDLSHETNENVVLLTLRLRPKSEIATANKNFVFIYKEFKLKEGQTINLNVDFRSFKKAGEVKINDSL